MRTLGGGVVLIVTIPQSACSADSSLKLWNAVHLQISSRCYPVDPEGADTEQSHTAVLYYAYIPQDCPEEFVVEICVREEGSDTGACVCYAVPANSDEEALRIFDSYRNPNQK